MKFNINIYKEEVIIMTVKLDLSDYGVNSLIQFRSVGGVDLGTIIGIDVMITHIFMERRRRAGMVDFSVMIINNNQDQEGGKNGEKIK